MRHDIEAEAEKEMRFYRVQNELRKVRQRRSKRQTVWGVVSYGVVMVAAIWLAVRG